MKLYARNIVVSKLFEIFILSNETENENLLGTEATPG